MGVPFPKDSTITHTKPGWTFFHSVLTRSGTTRSQNTDSLRAGIHRRGKKYPRQDSNELRDSQGNDGESGICPPLVPPSLSSVPIEALELLELWTALDADDRSKVVELARALARE
jgi:hypothetical protein